MTYIKREDIAGAPGEQVVQLDDDSLVAVQCTRVVQSGVIQYNGQARAIDELGATLIGPDGLPLVRMIAHSDRNAARADAVAKDCLLVLLGELPETVQWGSQYLLDVSIRQAIELAQVATGAVDAGGVL